MIELILIGAAAWWLAKRSKHVSGVGVPYQTYIRFDEPVAPRKTVTVKRVLDSDLAESDYIFRAADAYYRDMADYRYTDYKAVVSAFMQGAEMAEEENWFALPMSEYKAQMDSEATDVALSAPDFDEAYDAFISGAEFIIDKYII